MEHCMEHFSFLLKVLLKLKLIPMGQLSSLRTKFALKSKESELEWTPKI